MNAQNIEHDNRYIDGIHRWVWEHGGLELEIAEAYRTLNPSTPGIEGVSAVVGGRQVPIQSRGASRIFFVQVAGDTGFYCLQTGEQIGTLEEGIDMEWCESLRCDPRGRSEHQEFV
jgi:hypothetical protein